MTCAELAESVHLSLLGSAVFSCIVADSSLKGSKLSHKRTGSYILVAYLVKSKITRSIKVGNLCRSDYLNSLSSVRIGNDFAQNTLSAPAYIGNGTSLFRIADDLGGINFLIYFGVADKSDISHFCAHLVCKSSLKGIILGIFS